MNLSKLFSIHALITFAAGLVLIIAPEIIPSTVNIKMQPEQYLLSYFLGSAEIALAFLSFHAGKIQHSQSLKLLVNTFILFHLLTAGIEVYDLLRGGSIKLLANVFLRLVISALFLYYFRKQKEK